MKISKSKKELARIISENGGWRDGVEFFASTCNGIVIGSKSKPKYTSKYGWVAAGGFIDDSIELHSYLKNWHQTILSREEYFHLYPATDADGWIEWNGGKCPVGGDVLVCCKWRSWKMSITAYRAGGLSWRHNGDAADIIAYRLHKPEQAKYSAVGDDQANLADKKELETMEYKPSIEQLMQIHCDRAHALSEKKAEFLVAEKQELEALEALKAACMEAGFDIAPITTKQEPELVITDWHDLQAGDVISVSGKWWEPDSEYTVDENDGSRDAPIRVGGYWALIGECSFKFISRP